MVVQARKKTNERAKSDLRACKIMQMPSYSVGLRICCPMQKNITGGATEQQWK